MNPRRTVGRVLPLAAAVAVSVSATAAPSGAQTTADDGCYLYAFGFVNPFLVAELTIIRPPAAPRTSTVATTRPVRPSWGRAPQSRLSCDWSRLSPSTK